MTDNSTKIVKHIPFFSIILAVFNGYNYVARAVESIKTQTCSEWELYLVDDGSTDGTAALCRELVRAVFCQVKIPIFIKIIPHRHHGEIPTFSEVIRMQIS